MNKVSIDLLDRVWAWHKLFLHQSTEVGAKGVLVGLLVRVSVLEEVCFGLDYCSIDDWYVAHLSSNPESNPSHYKWTSQWKTTGKNIHWWSKAEEASIPAKRWVPITEIHSNSHESIGHLQVGDKAKVCRLMPADLRKFIIWCVRRDVWRQLEKKDVVIFTVFDPWMLLTDTLLLFKYL